ncbi:uncharacterized protein LOC118431373 [Branchiostoma floridae]|uniref:Uncharacterized protein LOC118431373 n=1 Tax=Branchiostoma floridae TaxID=7739 RepID=A0A9J7NBL8_BRAFL|nr:uncharacterized protein LOC118431373 [Branchiostoma floridae]XP_035698406.1 uncharacterized protein LOC118431373 [Branchiostoma floridae]XP_035698407.1 uncharacterized protein LOC118431373 [Branchiostoma floridae]
MAARCLVAFQHVDSESKKILRKHAKNRPLGDLHHKYQDVAPPSEEALTCTGVEAQLLRRSHLSKPKSASQLIEEQQRAVHNALNRGTRSAGAGRREVPASGRSSSSSNQGTTPAMKRSRSVMETGKHSSLSLRSQKSVWKVKSSVPKDLPEDRAYMRVRMDPVDKAWVRSKSLGDLSDQSKEMNRAELQPSRATTGYVKFQQMRNKAKNGVGYDTSAIYLSFAGGEEEKDVGVVDAFTDKDVGEYYSIEGHAGSKIADQLRKGNKIRIGINGEVMSHGLRVRTRSKEDSPRSEQDHFDIYRDDWDSSSNSTDMERVPLCWEDQVSRPGSRLLAPRSEKKEAPKPPMSGCQPVMFDKLIRHDMLPPNFVHVGAASPPGSAGKPSGQFRVKQRTKVKPAFNGTTPSSSQITVISIDNWNEELMTEERQQKEYDEVLWDKVIHGKARNELLSGPKSPTVSQTILPEKRARSPRQREEVKSAGQRSSRLSFTDGYDNVGKKLGVVRQQAIPTGKYSSSGSSVDFNYVGNGMNPIPGTLSVPTPANSPRVGFVGTVKPMPSKPLYRNGVASISVHGIQGDLNYIQIAQPLTAPVGPLGLHQCDSSSYSTLYRYSATVREAMGAVGNPTRPFSTSTNIFHGQEPGGEYEVFEQEQFVPSRGSTAKSKSSQGQQHVRFVEDLPSPSRVATPDQRPPSRHTPSPPAPTNSPDRVGSVTPSILLSSALAEGDAQKAEDRVQTPEVGSDSSRRPTLTLDSIVIPTAGETESDTYSNCDHTTVDTSVPSHATLRETLDVEEDEDSEEERSESPTLRYTTFKGERPGSATEEQLNKVASMIAKTVVGQTGSESEGNDSEDEQLNQDDERSSVKSSVFSESLDGDSQSRKTRSISRIDSASQYSSDDLQVSQETQELLESVAKLPIADAPQVAELLSYEPDKPSQRELAELRGQIKEDLKRTQEETQKEIQDIYMKQYA